MIDPVCIMVFLGCSFCFLGVPSTIAGFAGGSEMFGNLDSYVKNGVAGVGVVLTAIGAWLLLWSTSWSQF